MNDYETYEHNKLTISIWYDDNAESPLEWATAEERGVYFALKHNRYNLPYEIEADTEDYDSWQAVAEAVTAEGGELAGNVYKFVRWYEHSGVAVSLTDSDDVAGWDSGCAGVIFADDYDNLNATFTEWQAYIEGDVYGYAITNPRDNEVIDSCGGFYGLDAVKYEAEAIADAFKHPHDAAYAKNAVITH